MKERYAVTGTRKQANRKKLGVPEESCSEDKLRTPVVQSKVAANVSKNWDTSLILTKNWCLLNTKN